MSDGLLATNVVDVTVTNAALCIPRHRLSTYSQRAFAVAGLTMFNTVPHNLRDPAVSTATFRQSSFLCLSAHL